MLRSNGHLNVKQGHSLDNTCLFGTNLATKLRKSPFLGVQISKISPDPSGRSKGGGGLGTCFPPPPPLFFGFFSLFFTETKFTSKKLYVVLNEYEICLKMLEMAILETHISEISRGGMPPDPPRKLAPLALIVPPPPLKVLDPLELSHAQQFFNLGISATQG